MNLFAKKRIVGEDEFGNEYYVINKKRFIKYGSKVEATKISSFWHLWLHYATDVPEKIEGNVWQKQREHNLTGTKAAYYPSSSNRKKTLLYEAWKP